MLSGKRWEPATVTGMSPAPRSYVITTPNGQTFRRNRRHLSRAPLCDNLNYNDGFDTRERNEGKDVAEEGPLDRTKEDMATSSETIQEPTTGQPANNATEGDISNTTVHDPIPL